MKNNFTMIGGKIKRKIDGETVTVKHEVHLPRELDEKISKDFKFESISSLFAALLIEHYDKKIDLSKMDYFDVVEYLENNKKK